MVECALYEALAEKLAAARRAVMPGTADPAVGSFADELAYARAAVVLRVGVEIEIHQVLYHTAVEVTLCGRVIARAGDSDRDYAEAQALVTALSSEEL